MVRYIIRLSIIFAFGLLVGCSLPLENIMPNSAGNDRGETLGLEPEFSYEVIEQKPDILINQVGYQPADKKVAILQGSNLTNVFYVHNADTDEQVYVGSLKPDSLFKKEAEAESKKNNYLADFSTVEKAGSYYIYHPDLGYSYTFKIKDTIYHEVEKYVLTTLEEETDDTSLLCYQLACLLFTKEIYSENVLESERLDRFCRENIEKLMQVQDEKSGSVYADAFMALQMKDAEPAQKQQHISLAATAEFAGVMAEYAYILKETDKNFANQCQKAAEKAYNSIQNSLDNVGYDAGYFAATHLYRLTKGERYLRAIMQYTGMKEEEKSYTEYDFTLFGDYAYITLRKGISLEMGETLMKKILSKSEEISQTGGRINYYVSGNREYNDIDGKLRDMANMALVNYIITNHEYTTLQKNYIDYLMGRNPDNVCYIDGFGVKNIEEGNCKVNNTNAGLFYLLLQASKV